MATDEALAIRAMGIVDELIQLFPDSKDIPKDHQLRGRPGWIFVAQSDPTMKQCNVLTLELVAIAPRLEQQLRHHKIELSAERIRDALQIEGFATAGTKQSGRGLFIDRRKFVSQMIILRSYFSIEELQNGGRAETHGFDNAAVDCVTRPPESVKNEVFSSGGSSAGGAEGPPKPDGPDESRMILVLNGHEFGPFTATQFDIIKIMWDHRESAYSVSNAFFEFHLKLTWPQTSESPFGKHQTAIQAVFTQNGFGLPWNRRRGVFFWRGLVPPKAKAPTKRNVSRGKKR